MGGVTEYTMPSGKSCFYKDSDHTYWEGYDEKKGSCSGRISGASTLAKNDGQTNIDGLLDWAARLTCEGVAREFSADLRRGPLNGPKTKWLTGGDTIGGRLSDMRQTWRDIRNEKGDQGNAAHNVLEQLCEGVTPAFSGGHEMAVLDWFKKTRPDVTHYETVVYDHEHGVAGRFDLMHGHESPTLLDLKTGSVREAAMVQLNIYAVACRVAGYPTPERLVILDTFDSGGWREIEVPIRPGWALTAITTARNGREMRRALTAAKKSARTGQASADDAAQTLLEVAP